MYFDALSIAALIAFVVTGVFVWRLVFSKDRSAERAD